MLFHAGVVFKGEQESITAEQLRAILEEFGEPLKDAEFAELLKGVELGPNGDVSLDAFKTLLSNH